MWQNSKTHCGKIWKLKQWQNLKTQKTQTVTKLKNWNCDKTRKLKLWHNSKTQIVSAQRTEIVTTQKLELWQLKKLELGQD